MSNKTPDPTPERTLARDEFSVALREKTNHPTGVVKQSQIDMTDFYGNLVSWIVRTVRVEGQDTVFLQLEDGKGGARLVLPPQVTSVLARHREGAVTVGRKRAAAQGAATRLLKKASAA